MLQADIIYTTLFITLCASIGCLYAHLERTMKKHKEQIEELIHSMMNDRFAEIEDIEHDISKHSQWISSVSKEIHGNEKSIEKLTTDTKKELNAIHALLKISIPIHSEI